MTKFTLQIELGNDAMQDGSDIARALHKLAKKLAHERLGLPDYGKIMDDNGNSVGTWEVS